MEKLDVEEYPVPKEHLKFYELILKIDKIPPEEPDIPLSDSKARLSPLP